MTDAFCKQKSCGKPPTWVVFSLLVFCNTLLSSSAPTYEWQDPITKERLVCQQCPPGTCVAQYCTKDKPTQCQPCPSLYYTQYWNYLDNCLYCNNICSGLEEEALPCNATHDRVCQCKPGYYFDPSSEFCLPHSACPLGSGVAQPGTPHEDTKCAACPPGTFSNSSTGLCQPHTNCSAHGLKLNVPGNPFHDSLCTACQLNQTDGTQEWLEEASESPECELAFIDFAVYQINSPKKLWALKHALEQEAAPKEGHNNQLMLQAEIYAYLTRIRNIPTQVSVAKELLLAFQRTQQNRVKSRLSSKFRKWMRAL
ncbi:PREDICTED: tumor necrosis factor receptor superfamily member 6B-like isoform X2 [Gekko japonicus]|uniref:Tumor necrosis factor receptor superfamily member 6B-like isoform X2 n=1 Tax=Gekko japonicus TaxID=146911 RepID=A0ABM1LFP1_GEKJA|nr:PREDICTED: tumor necrosis factor receptor superfamily member 6B-like isoform X2 [Gekko japonicus]